MPGGQLNIVAIGQQNVILTENPSKTFWKSSYAKFTNFGKQNFRLDSEGNSGIRLSEESVFTFKVPRYADLLMDSYLSFDLPHIWSPILPPQEQDDGTFTDWAPYEFKWIDNIGAQLIKQIAITCGNQKLQEFSGQYLLAMVQRDYSDAKKRLFDEMSGNVSEMTDPGNSGARTNAYPNAFYTDNQAGAEPSIRGRTIYVPLNSWFGLKSQMSFPLIALQNNELTITITLRPIKELFQIRDVMDSENQFPYVAPNFNRGYMQFYRFLQTPPDISLDTSSYVDTRTIWNTNIHLNCTYCFLSDDERDVFAKKEQTYLFRQVRETIYRNVTGANKISVDSLGLVAGWMMYFQRSDANLRNEWSNRTNWPYAHLPSDLVPAETEITYEGAPGIGPGINYSGNLTGMLVTDTYTIQNQKSILRCLGILTDGQYRENVLPVGVFDYLEKYTRTAGSAPEGLYCYNFCLNTSPFEMQPSGAMNMSKFTQIEFEFSTIIPPHDPNAQTLSICDPSTGDVIGVNKSTWQIYEYNYDLVVMEERYNIVSFIGGNAGLMYAT